MAGAENPQGKKGRRKNLAEFREEQARRRKKEPKTETGVRSIVVEGVHLSM